MILFRMLQLSAHKQVRWLCLPLLAALVMPVQAQRTVSEDRVIASFDFAQPSNADATEWLKNQGFEFKLSAADINPHFQNNRLVLETAGQYAGLIAKQVNVDSVDRVRITWGVSEYPEGANWAAGVYRVPIAVMLSFGDKTVDSGSFFIPDTPYFVGLFLGEHEQEGRAYKAEYYQKGGRYFCQPCGPEPGKVVTTVFDFDEVLQDNFGISSQLPVTSVGIQMNTTDTQGGAKAFIEKIEFLADADRPEMANLADASDAD